jgi:hypothetical protein
MNDFQFEGYPMKGMETIIVNLDPLNEAYGTKIDGMLGFNFLEQGIVTINLVKNNLESGTIIPTSHESSSGISQFPPGTAAADGSGCPDRSRRDLPDREW